MKILLYIHLSPFYILYIHLIYLHPCNDSNFIYKEFLFIKLFIFNRYFKHERELSSLPIRKTQQKFMYKTPTKELILENVSSSAWSVLAGSPNRGLVLINTSEVPTSQVYYTPSYDIKLLSSELAAALQDSDAAIICCQLDYWLKKENVGKVIDGVKYIHNTYKRWRNKQFQWLSIWEIRNAMNKLRALGIVKVTRYMARKWNQTNYYTIDYERLKEFLEQFREEIISSGSPLDFGYISDEEMDGEDLDLEEDDLDWESETERSQSGSSSKRSQSGSSSKRSPSNKTSERSPKAEKTSERSPKSKPKLNTQSKQSKSSTKNNSSIEENINTEPPKSAVVPEKSELRGNTHHVVTHPQNDVKVAHNSSLHSKSTVQRDQSKNTHPHPHHHPHMERACEDAPAQGGGGNTPTNSKNSSKASEISQNKCVDSEIRSNAEVKGKSNAKPKLSDVIARPKKPGHAPKPLEDKASSAGVEQRFNKYSSKPRQKAIYFPPVQEPVQGFTPVQESVQEPEVVQETVPITEKPKPKKTPKGTKPKQSYPNALFESIEEREAFREALTTAIANGVGKARNPIGLVNYVINEITQGRSHTYWDEWKKGLGIGFSEKKEWEAAPNRPYPKFIEYLISLSEYENETRQQAIYRIGKMLKDETIIHIHWRDFRRTVEVLRQLADKAHNQGYQVTIPEWFVDKAEISIERAGESAMRLSELTPHQKDWIIQNLPEAEKLMNGTGDLSLAAYASENSSSVPPGSANPEQVGDECEDDEFCFNGYIDLQYLEHQAVKITNHPNNLSMLLVDFRAAMRQANQKQRQKIKAMLLEKCPELLEHL